MTIQKFQNFRVSKNPNVSNNRIPILLTLKNLAALGAETSWPCFSYVNCSFSEPLFWNTLYLHSKIVELSAYIFLFCNVMCLLVPVTLHMWYYLLRMYLPKRIIVFLTCSAAFKTPCFEIPCIYTQELLSFLHIYSFFVMSCVF